MGTVVIATIIDAAASGAADLYIRIAALAIGPAIGFAVYGLALIWSPR